MLKIIISLLYDDIICHKLIEHIDQNIYEENIEKIINLLKNNTAKYYLLTRNLAERKYNRDLQKDVFEENKEIEQIEKLIEIKYQCIQYFPNAPPVALKGQLSKNYEEGLNLVMSI